MVYRIIFRWTSQSLSNGCIVAQLNLDRLDIDVVDHRGLLVNSHGIKFCFRFIVDVAVAVHHGQSSYYHGRIDRRDLGVAVLRTIITVLRQTQPQFSSLLGCSDISCFLHVLLLSNNDAYPQPELHSISFQGGRRCRQSSTYHSAIFVSGIQVCLFLAILI